MMAEIKKSEPTATSASALRNGEEVDDLTMAGDEDEELHDYSEEEINGLWRHWVDLGNPSSRGSAGSVIYASSAVVLDACSSTRGSRHSPKSVKDNNVVMNPTLEAVKFKLVRDMRPITRDTDWLWDWSSRPEAVPPKQYRFYHPAGTTTTPPNSPRMSSGNIFKCSGINYWLSLRHTKAIRSDLFRVEVLSLLIVSNVLSLCIGYWLCQKFATTKLAL